MFVLIFSNQDNNSRRHKGRRYYLTKIIIKNYNNIVIEKNLYDQPIDSDIKRYEEIRTLTIRQSEDYTTGCLLNYEYIKNYYRLKTVDLNRQKEIDTDSKAIQQIEIVEQLKNTNGVNADGTQSMFVVTVLEKVKERRLQFSQESVTTL